VAAVVATLGVAAALVAPAGRDETLRVAAPLGQGDRNPLAARAGAPGPTAAPSATVTTTPPTTLPVPVAMVLPPGPAPVVTRVATTDPVIFLGIDDGLVRDPAVLDYLGAHEMPFTAFLVPGYMQADPEYWARARKVGGTVQAHSLTHPNLTKAPAGQIREELCGSADAIQQTTGIRPTLFRPPYGAYNRTVQAIASECGYAALVMWQGTTNDGRVELQEQVLAAGDVLLLHWREDLLVNLRNLKALADAQGLRVARLEDYLQPQP
jgi:peptidoglycan/xylan/chitin deacetylase (PgdA/CDA1 family)